MKKLLACLVLTCSQISATPAINDFVGLDYNFRDDYGWHGPYRVEELLRDYDLNRRQFQEERRAYNGNTVHIEREWVDQEKYLTDQQIQDIIYKKCNAYQGIKDRITVKAGTFDACKFHGDCQDRQGRRVGTCNVWVVYAPAVYPVGYYRASLDNLDVHTWELVDYVFGATQNFSTMNAKFDLHEYLNLQNFLENLFFIK